TTDDNATLADCFVGRTSVRQPLAND
ncbi:MAG: hypothetical protein ACJA2G_001841, partial [Cognaticolwellia sp.]